MPKNHLNLLVGLSLRYVKTCDYSRPQHPSAGKKSVEAGDAVLLNNIDSLPLIMLIQLIIIKQRRAKNILLWLIEKCENFFVFLVTNTESCETKRKFLNCALKTPTELQLATGERKARRLFTTSSSRGRPGSPCNARLGFWFFRLFFFFSSPFYLLDL